MIQVRKSAIQSIYCPFRGLKGSTSSTCLDQMTFNFIFLFLFFTKVEKRFKELTFPSIVSPAQAWGRAEPRRIPQTRSPSRRRRWSACGSLTPALSSSSPAGRAMSGRRAPLAHTCNACRSSCGCNWQKTINGIFYYLSEYHHVSVENEKCEDLQPSIADTLQHLVENFFRKNGSCSSCKRGPTSINIVDFFLFFCYVYMTNGQNKAKVIITAKWIIFENNPMYNCKGWLSCRFSHGN